MAKASTCGAEDRGLDLRSTHTSDVVAAPSGVMGSDLELVGKVVVYCDWARSQI